MKQYKTALFIGRFQPLHKGHVYSLKKCVEMAEHVVVGIGSSQEKGTENNPWDYETRKEMITSVMGDSVTVVAIPDNLSDAVWLHNLLKIVGQFDVVVSNNNWVLSIMKEAGYQTYETGLYNRDELEGVKIRKLMRAGDTGYQKRLPRTIVAMVATSAL